MNTKLKEIKTPNIDTDSAVIIDVLVNIGDTVDEETCIIEIESDKASMQIPANAEGVIKEIKVKEGDKVSEGDILMLVEAQAGAETQAAPQPETIADKAPTAEKEEEQKPAVQNTQQQSLPELNASPAVRRIIRELNLDHKQITATGKNNRITKEDLESFVKAGSGAGYAPANVNTGDFNVMATTKIDFSQFGEIETIPLSRIQKISGPTLHRNWVTIPHVTQFDEADITELENFRKKQNEILVKQKADFKITPLVFIMKAVAKNLINYPLFNSSLSHDQQSLIQKKYVHLGVAVNTPNGLVVPVIRDVDKKTISELSRELITVSQKAREGKLSKQDMQGSCFTISSLGGIGGTAFTPIVNYPDVAILGVSRSEMKPKYNGKEFEPRLMLPLSLSYDHRVIDGAIAAEFTVQLSALISDIRKIIL